MAIDIRAIKIMLDTNIPGKGPIPFTKSMLYNPVLKSTDGFNEYPYFTMDVVFPEWSLAQLTYEQQVGFFFDKSKMERILQKYAKVSDSQKDIQKDMLEFPGEKQNKGAVAVDKRAELTSASVESEMQNKKMEQSENASKNVMIMLRLLFPTRYPVTNNLMTSFASVITKTPEISVKFSDFVPSFLRERMFNGLASYSYLKIDDKIHTISQVIWLNDLYNHNEYGQLVDKFDKLNKWKAKEIVKLQDEIERKHKKFNKQYTVNLNDIKTDDLLTLKNKTQITRELSPDLKTIYTEFNALIDNLISTINALKELLKDETSKNNQEISETAKQLSTYYSTLSESKYRTYFNPKNKTVLDKFISNLGRDIEEILVLEYIQEVYLSRPGLNIDFEKDEQKYRDKLKEKYRTYTDFVDNIKKYRAPYRESSNPVFQNTIDDFLDNSELVRGMFNFIMNPYHLGKNPIKEYLKQKSSMSEANRAKLKAEKGSFYKRMDTGVSLLLGASETEPYFEIYVQVNLIGGELNDENRGLVDCMYKDESLTNRLEFLLNQSIYYPWTLKSSRMFFDITHGEAKDVIKSAEKEQKTDETKPTEEPVVKKGGKMTRKMREKFMRSTHRRY